MPWFSPGSASTDGAEDARLKAASTKSNASPTTLKARLEGVGLLGVSEAGEGLRGAALIDFDFYGAFGLGAGFAEQGEGGDGFVVNLSNQIRFAGIVLFPNLADLDFAGRHSTNVDRFEVCVNNAAAV